LDIGPSDSIGRLPRRTKMAQAPGRHHGWSDDMRASVYAAFEPCVVDVLCEALAGVLAALGVGDDDADDVSDRAARKLVELAEAGVRDPEKLKAEALRWLRH